MISLSCFACMKGLHRIVESAINSCSSVFHSVYQTQSFTGVVSKSGGSSCDLMSSTHIIYEELDYLTFFEVRD